MIWKGWPFAIAASAVSLPTAARSRSPESTAARTAGSPPGTEAYSSAIFSAAKVLSARDANVLRKLREFVGCPSRILSGVVWLQARERRAGVASAESTAVRRLISMQSLLGGFLRDALGRRSPA